MNEFGLKPEIFDQLLSLFAAIPEVEKVYVYGSRARGDFRDTSDIDLVYESSQNIDGKLFVALQDLPTALKFDFINTKAVANDDFRRNIDRDKKLIYAKNHPSTKRY